MTRLKNLNNQDGLTLVELLGSIVILSIILVTFLAFFIQSAKTTKVSGEMIDASYIAQQQAEEIYNQTNYRNYAELINYLIESDYAHTHKADESIDELSIEKDDYRIELYLSPAENEEGAIADLYTLLIEVYDSTDKQSAQVETKFFIDGVGEDGHED